MGERVQDGAYYRACTECIRVCQTTHGKGLPHLVPRFSKAIPEYSMPFSKDCNLQIPASFVRAHIPAKEQYSLEGVTGSEWEVTFVKVGFKDGWRSFATDYQLEKGDQAMFALVAPKRFYVNVFDKFGMEKFSARQPVTSRSSPSTMTRKAIQLGPRNETPVSNSTRGADGTPQHAATQAVKPNAVCAQTSGKASGQNCNHDAKLSSLSRKRALIEKEDLPREPVEDHEAEPSFTSQSSEASDDSVEIRLAKAVLARAKQKKLKKRKTSCTSTPQVEAVAEATRSEGTLAAEEPEVCKSLRNEVRAMELKNMSIEDRISKGVAILSSYVDTAGSPRGDDDETLFEKPCEDPRIGVSNDDLVTLDVGHERGEPQNLSNGVTDQPGRVVAQEIALLDQRQYEALGETETSRGATGEDPALKGSEIRQTGELQPSPIFQPGLVKQEPDLRIADSHPHQTCEKCTNCGLRKGQTPIQPRKLKSEPVTSESPETPEIRNPSYAPSSSTRKATEDQKQQALIAAKDFVASTTNPSAFMVMRVGLIEKSYDYFVSLQCAEMLPTEPTELILVDAKGLQCKANWNSDRRYIQGPGWRDFVDSHNLQVNDVCVMEVIEKSEQQCIVLIHIFHAHEMVDLPVQASPGVTHYVQEFPAGAKTRSSNLLHGLSPPSTNKRTKAPNVDEAVRTGLPRPRTSTYDARVSTELPGLSTMRISRSTSSSPSTPGRARAAVPPSSTNKRTKAPNVDEAVWTVLPRPPAYIADARADKELPESSTMTRPRRTSSSPLKPATATASVPTSDTGDEPFRDAVREDAKLARRVKQKAGRRRHNLYTPHVQKKVVMAIPKASPLKASKVTTQQHRSTDESEKQVRTRNSRKLHYPVAKMIDRRKNETGVSFLVELGKPVNQSIFPKRMKAKQDEKGRWWVPHHHFTKDFHSCFIE